MSIYKLSFKELTKLAREFNKTAYGRKACASLIGSFLLALCNVGLMFSSSECPTETSVHFLFVSGILFAIVNIWQYAKRLF